MENLTVDTVYGLGLFEAGSELNMLDAIQEELQAVRDAFKEYPELAELLKRPTLRGEDKKDVLKKIFEGKLSAPTLNFLFVLVDKRRIGQFTGIVRAFEKLMDERNGITKGMLYSAVTLSDAQIAKLEDETGRLLQKNVKLTNELDVDLIGGVRIYIDGKIFDASIRSRIDQMKQTLLRQ
ncbi:MAG: F0F1 ATP synthase subunit delta [Clostridiales Family XIII bacterium]|jgi:ATP synthase F1 delta subunit|nr:F0F1 ATP synthase subunit delta [Clostridiales Family XIII bacterium]